MDGNKVHCIDIFILICLASLNLYDVFGDEVNMMSVMEGDSVTLHTEVIKQKDDVMLWCYGPENNLDLVAQINGKIGSTKYYEGRFRGRVNVNAQTGDLTIRDMRTEHSGLYTLKITSNNKVSYKKYNVNVYGVFGEEVKMMSVMEGDSVTLHTEVIKQKDDVMLWCYGPENDLDLVAQINGKIGSTKYYEGRFRGRVNVNAQTGDLTIRDMRTEHSGLYTLKISSNNKVSYKKFNVNVNGVFGVEVNMMSVMEGESVTLHTEVIKQKDDVMVWYYGPDNSFIAFINGNIDSTRYYEGDDGRFRGRVNVNDQTGDLSIRDMRTEHSGLYTLKITISNKVSYKRFNVTVHARLPVPVITRNSSSSSSSSSSSKCSVLCSVLNVSHVSLSWYKGSSLLSSISVSDLNIRLSLPLEVDYEDTNTHTCVLNNTIMNHTQLLHITQLCKCSAVAAGKRINIIPVLLVFIFVVCVIIGVYVHRRDARLMKTLPAKVPLTDEEQSISSSSSEDIEDSGGLHGKHILLNQA